MPSTAQYTVNLGLPAIPESVDPKLFPELVRIYNALNLLAQALDTYTTDGTLTISVQTIKNILEGTVDTSAELAELNKTVKTYVVPWATPGTIGSITSNTGKFTTLESVSTVVTGATGVIPVSITAATGAQAMQLHGRVADNLAYIEFLPNSGAGYGGAIYSDGITKLVLTSQNGTDAAVITNNGLKVLNWFGCNGKAVQSSFALPAASTDLPTVIALANAIRTALINNGICS